MVLLCLDTLRADALPAVPAASPSMPAFAEFARTATVFRDATSSSAWTAPSVATLLTGLEPAHTGVRGTTAGALVPSVSTLAETLSAAGWSTAAVTAGGWVAPERGYAQGFDSFEIGFDLKTPEALVSSWAARKRKDRPFFLFLHSYLPHDPYGPKDESAHRVLVPAEVTAEAARIAREAEEAGGRLSIPGALRLLELFLTDGPGRFAVVATLGDQRAEALWRQIIERIDEDLAGTPGLLEVATRARKAYLAGLAHADRIFARTLAALAGANLPKGTAVVVVGDHGEAFGEHGTVLHARRLWDELVRVPLVVAAPGRLPAGTVVAGSCGLVDVAATILDLAGVPPAGPLDGVSLIPAANGRAPGHPIFAEEDRNATDAGTVRRFRALSVRTEKAKYVLTYDLKTSEVTSEDLFDLAVDPAETHGASIEGLARYGDPFCRGVARVRSLVPGFTPTGACAK